MCQPLIIIQFTTATPCPQQHKPPAGSQKQPRLQSSTQSMHMSIPCRCMFPSWSARCQARWRHWAAQPAASAEESTWRETYARRHKVSTPQLLGAECRRLYSSGLFCALPVAWLCTVPTQSSTTLGLLALICGCTSVRPSSSPVLGCVPRSENKCMVMQPFFCRQPVPPHTQQQSRAY